MAELNRWVAPATGQPQDIRNKIVTYDGLLDYNELLRNQIPLMGYDNAAALYSYAFGISNTADDSYGFAVGYKNHVKSKRGIALGGENTTSNGIALGSKNTSASDCGIILGRNNTDEGDIENLILGWNNTTKDGCSIILGTENILDVGCAVVIGNNNYVPHSPNGDLYVLGSANRFAEHSQEPERNEIFGYFLGSGFEAWDDGYTKPVFFTGQYNDATISYSNCAFCIGDGTQAKRSNLLKLDYDGGISIKGGYLTTAFTCNNQVTFNGSTVFENGATFNGTVTINKSLAFEFQSDAKLTDDLGITLMNQSGFRHTLIPSAYNEAYWYIDRDYQELKINPTNPQLARNLQVPDQITFYAGSKNSFATLRCGSVQYNSLRFMKLPQVYRHIWNKSVANSVSYTYTDSELPTGFFWINIVVTKHVNNPSSSGLKQEYVSYINFCAFRSDFDNTISSTANAYTGAADHYGNKVIFNPLSSGGAEMTLTFAEPGSSDTQHPVKYDVEFNHTLLWYITQ